MFKRRRCQLLYRFSEGLRILYNNYSGTTARTAIPINIHVCLGEGRTHVLGMNLKLKPEDSTAVQK